MAEISDAVVAKALRAYEALPPWSGRFARMRAAPGGRGPHTETRGGQRLMAATMIFTGPEPPEGGKWCVVCSRLYKGEFLQLPATAHRMNQANKLGPEETVYFKISFGTRKPPPLNEAVTTAMFPMPWQWSQGQAIPAPADVCWTHIDALINGKSGIVAVPASAMPAEQGAVLLGGGRV
jgi:hypothetical protein